MIPFKKLLIVNFKEAFGLFVFTVFSVVARGYEFGTGNQIHYLTYLNYQLNPSLFSRDYLFKIHDISYTLYMSFLKVLPGISSHTRGIIFTVYFVFLFFFNLGIFLTAQRLFGKKRVSWLSLFAFLIPVPVAGTTIFTVEKSFIPRFAAEVFLIFAFYFLLTKRYLTSAVFGALCLLFNPLTAVIYPVILLVMCALRQLTFKKLFFALVVFTVLVLPFFVSFISSQQGQGLVYDSAWKSVLAERTPYVFILSWSVKDYLLLTLLPVFFLVYPFLLKKRFKTDKVVFSALAAAYALLILAFVFDFFVLRTGVQLQLARNLFLPIVLSLVFAANLVVEYAGLMSLVFFAAGLTVISFSLPERRTEGFLWKVKLTDYQKTAVWAGENTANDATFLVPCEESGFRLWSLRSVVCENKEGGDALYDRGLALEWDRREDLLEDYETFDTNKINNLKSEFGVNYMVTKENLSYSLAFKSGSWNVYKID